MVPLFHVVHPNWRKGKPLYPWHLAVERGIFGRDEWQHRRVPVGYDGDLVSFHRDLPNAMTYAEDTGKRILRVWLRPAEIVSNAEECLCRRGSVLAGRIELVSEEWIAAVQAWRDQIADEVRRSRFSFG